VIELTPEMRAAACRRMGVDDLDPWTEAALVDVLTIHAIDQANADTGLDLIDVVPTRDDRCIRLECTGCGWTWHQAPGSVGGKALAHIVDLARAHAREVDHGDPS
jgi:hypothetical protein